MHGGEMAQHRAGAADGRIDRVVYEPCRVTVKEIKIVEDGTA